MESVKILPKKIKLNKLICLLKENVNYDKLLFKDKISFIRNIILSSTKKDVIKKIFIFGSYINGKATEESDIDICVIIDNRYNRSNISHSIRLSLFNNNIIPCDLLVSNENIFYNVKNIESVENTIIKEGVLIYG